MKLESKLSEIRIFLQRNEKTLAVAESYTSGALAMAENVKKLMEADYGISTTGVAGPSEDEFGSAVGTAWGGISSKKQTKAYFFI